MHRFLVRRQFRVLYRNFLLQIVDLELVAAHGDPSRLLMQIGALLVSLSFIIAISIIPQYQRATASEIALGSWGDQEFLISTTMAVAGMFTVFAWDSIFPSRRDSLVLGSLPIRSRTIFRAKIAATATGLGLCVLAVNAATGLAYPFVIGGVRTFLAYWAAMVASGLWVFCTLLALQGLTALLFSYRLFLKISNVLQVAGFFAILGVYFLTPGPLDLDVSQGIPAIAQRLPSFWFLGLFQRMNISSRPVFAPLAGRALIWLTVSVSIAAVTYALSYYRNSRRIVEEPDIVPADRARAASGWLRWAVAKCIPGSLDRAVVLFAGRTLVRSRMHRNLLAVFGGLGLAISLGYAKGLLFGNTRMYALARRYGFQPPHWYEVNTPMMAAGFVLLVLAVVGTRAAFALPVALKANWIFRITAVHSPKAYFAAVRKAMFTVAAGPVWVVASIFYLFVWGGPEALGHVLILLGVGALVVDIALTGFRKMPFACTYVPGGSNLRIKLPVYGTVFLLGADLGTRAERSMFESAGRTLLFGAILVSAIIAARRRWTRFAGDPFEQVQFEAEPVREVAPLDLSGDGAYGRLHRYLDVINAPPEPGFRQRAIAFLMKAAVVTACFCAVGFAYERVAEWRNPLPPRVGQSLNIGGRSLNYSCVGQGSPAVIFENGSGGAGRDWVAFQREVSGYTRACWYDRAGQGWSDAAPFPHPASAIADDLHRLLSKVHVAPPYVLVGLSSGGICTRVYAQRYPSEVAGMVLVDSAHTDENEPIVPPGGGYVPYFPHAFSVLAQILRPIGVLRLIFPPGPLSPFETRTFAESLKEEMVYESRLEARAVRSLGDTPLIVLTAGRHRLNPPDNPIQARLQNASEAAWIEAQKQLVRLSTRGEQRVFPEARHNLLLDRPKDVLEAIRDVVDQARALR